MTKENQSFEIWQNQSAQITVNVDQANSTDAQSLTGATLGFWLTTNLAGSDAVLSYFSSDGDITLVDVDSTDDGIRLTIPATDSSGLSGTYFYEIWAKDSSSAVAPVTLGSITVNAATGSL
jgi:hypothetical protein